MLPAVLAFGGLFVGDAAGRGKLQLARRAWGSVAWLSRSRAAGTCSALVGVAVAVATLAACGSKDAATPMSPTSPRTGAAAGGTIRFADRTGFVTVRPDGSGRHRIEIDDAYLSGGDSGEHYGECAWSPDGLQLACEDSEGMFIWLFAADGSDRRALTEQFNASGFVGQLTWSPDSRRIAFLEHSEDLGGPFLGDLYAVAVRTGKVERLTTTPEFQEGEPLWSPDGARVAFGEYAGRGDGKDGVFVLDLATGRTRRLVDGFPAVWSPDGTALGYSTGKRPGEPAGVWVFELETGRTRRLADGDWGGGEWSPDGTTIAYRTPAPASALALIDADGSGEPRIISESPAYSASWSPDGAHLVYETQKGVETRLVVADADGQDPRVLVRGCCPEWAPVTP